MSLTVSELISLLNDCDPDAELNDAWGNEITGIDDTFDEDENPPIVMILS
jgi:hypothetical protein